MRLMFNILKSEKKKGFTLLELVTVLAVISILSAALIPKVGNYINEAKKVAVLNEAKSVVTAYEAVRYKLNVNENTIASKLQGDNLPIEEGTLKKLKNSTVSQCKLILDTETNGFKINTEEKSISIFKNTDNTIIGTIEQIE
ncbi:MAG: type II secretion system protein [Clostridium sp.]|nr:type II secretion system protein [Clostridium sp.]MCI9303227.1 type II secretion system protein [Clostridium sp.]